MRIDFTSLRGRECDAARLCPRFALIYIVALWDSLALWG
jgi:hypothetical protein